MRSISNNVRVYAPLPLDVAVHRLHLCTGHRWRGRSLLSLAITRNMRLLARVPAGLPTVHGQIDGVHGEITPGAPMADGGFAALLTVHLHQLLRTGRTATEYPEAFDAPGCVTRWFVEPVHVSLCDIFVPHQAFKETLEIWKSGKRGDLIADEVPEPIWYAVTRRLTMTQLEGMAHQPELRRVMTVAKWRNAISLPAPWLPPERPFSGTLQTFKQIRPRALWLMNLIYHSRDEWASLRRQQIRKSNLARRVAGQLDREGTRGPSGDRLSEKAVSKLVLDWVMPSAPLGDDTPRQHSKAKGSWFV